MTHLWLFHDWICVLFFRLFFFSFFNLDWGQHWGLLYNELICDSIFARTVSFSNCSCTLFYFPCSSLISPYLPRFSNHLSHCTHLGCISILFFLLAHPSPLCLEHPFFFSCYNSWRSWMPWCQVFPWHQRPGHLSSPVTLVWVAMVHRCNPHNVFL